MSKRTIVALARSLDNSGDFSVTAAGHVVIWISDKERLQAAREALITLRATFPSIEEIAFKEGDEIGVKASFGELDVENLAIAEEEAAQVLSDDHWADLADPEAPVASLLDEIEENFGSVRIRVQDDCFYVTSMAEDTPLESVQIPF